MFFRGLPGGSSDGGEGDPAVFGRTFVVLFWSLVIAIVFGFVAMLFQAAA